MDERKKRASEKRLPFAVFCTFFSIRFPHHLGVWNRLPPPPLYEGVNGVNRLATNGKKHYRLPTKREKNYRHGPTLSIFFSERRVYCIFSTFLGSNQRYHVTSLLQIHHKTRILKSVCRAYAKNFCNPPSPTH